jgi:SAM-dependent methyltransferase
MKPLLSRFVRERRYQAVSPYIIGDVLDLGCGLAELTELLKPGQDYTGVEHRADLVDRNRRCFPQFTFHCLDLERDALDLGRVFDTVAMVAVVEHLKNPEHIFNYIPGHLKPGGRLVITTPSPFGGAIHALGSQFGLFYREARDDHETMFSRPALEPRLSRSGLQIIRYKKFLLGGNQLFVCQAA